MELKERIAKLEAELNELKAELNKKEYCLNVFTEKPQYEEKYWIVFANGEIDWWGDDGNDDYFENTILFKDQRSAETYKELRSDMKRLSNALVLNKPTCSLFYDHDISEVQIEYVRDWERQSHYFTKENAQFILDKYGQEVLKNYILYCK